MIMKDSKISPPVLISSNLLIKENMDENPDTNTFGSSRKEKFGFQFDAD